jgi:hypothetical protein
MSDRILTNGQPVPADGSHKAIDPLTGQQKGYIVLTAEERAKGFVKPVRKAYIHEKCGDRTSMGSALAETYARDPYFYSGTFCCNCGAHFPLDQFHWEDGEPMDPLKQEDWAADQSRIKQNRETLARLELEKKERAEFWRLKAKYYPAEEVTPAQEAPWCCLCGTRHTIRSPCSQAQRQGDDHG